MAVDREVTQSKVVRIGAWAALVTGAVLLVKVAHIFVVDGEEYSIQGILYLAGVVLAIGGAAGIGARYGSSRPRRIALGFAAFFGFLFFLTMLSDGVGALVEAVSDGPQYVADEMPIALAGIVWLIAGYKLRSSSDR
jgi:hypothetical protein